MNSFILVIVTCSSTWPCTGYGDWDSSIYYGFMYEIIFEFIYKFIFIYINCCMNCLQGQCPSLLLLLLLSSFRRGCGRSWWSWGSSRYRRFWLQCCHSRSGLPMIRDGTPLGLLSSFIKELGELSSMLCPDISAVKLDLPVSQASFIDWVLVQDPVKSGHLPVTISAEELASIELMMMTWLQGLAWLVWQRQPDRQGTTASTSKYQTSNYWAAGLLRLQWGLATALPHR